MLCFKGRCYPAGTETASSAEYTKPRKNFFNEGQRNDLKKKMIERYLKQFGKENKEGITNEIDQFFANCNEINSTSIHFLQQSLTKKFPKSVGSQVHRSCTSELQRGDKNPYTETAVHPAHQPAGPATQPNIEHLQSQEISSSISSRQDKYSSSESDFKLPSLSKQQLMEVQPIAWRNDEEKWGTIYKYNAYIYKQEQKLERLRAQHKMQSVKNQLEEQVREKERQKQKEKEQQLSFLTLNKQLKDLEKHNDDLKEDHKKAKIIFQREMRQKQMAENKAKRDKEARDEKAREELTTVKIKEELNKEKDEADDLKRKKLEEMRRVMAENEERKIIMAQIKEQEKIEDVELQRKAREVGEELERQRVAEFKKKADRISDIIKSSEEAVNTIKKKQQENDYRNRRYQQLKDKILYEKELKDKQEELDRKRQLREFLLKQAEDKKNREKEVERELREQGQIWKSQNDQFSAYLDGKKQQKLDNLARYKEDLKIQMDDKTRREQEMAALKITSDEGKMNQVFLNKLRQLEVEEEILKKEIAQMQQSQEAVPS